MQPTLKKLAAPALALAIACVPLHAVLAQSRVLIVDDVGGHSLKTQSFDMLKKLIEDKLGKQVAITITSNDAMYNENSEVQAEQLGAVSFAWPGIGILTATFPKLAVITLPYLLNTPAAIDAAVKDPNIGGVMFADMRAKGLEPLGIWLNGPREIGRTGDKPILWPADLKGVKIRVAPGEVYVNAFKQLDANVTTMSFASVPTALRQGVLDAVEPTPNAWVSSHLYEIARQITKTAYIWDYYIVIGNKAWWDGMPAPTRKIFKDALDQTTKWNWDNVNAANDHAFDVMKAAGDKIYELAPEQLQAWKDAERPLWDRLGDKLVGPDVMKQLIAIGQKYQ